MNSVTAFAPTNIALAKYWGKRDTSLNLPSNSSLSITLDHFGTTTKLTLNKNLTQDSLFINGNEIHNPSSLNKIKNVLNTFRNLSNQNIYAQIESENNFPTGAGLASSASGLAALTLAASKIYNVDLTLDQLSCIARIGSGSACRSLYSGYVLWNRGELANGTDSHAKSLYSKAHWELDVLICVVNSESKITGSTDGMILTQNTSPYFESWTKYAEQSCSTIQNAIDKKDFSLLSQEAEANCLRMHACAMASNPAIFYFKPQTLEIISKVYEMRKIGLDVFFTIDAGPNVVLVCNPNHTKELIRNFSQYHLLQSKISDGARIL